MKYKELKSKLKKYDLKLENIDYFLGVNFYILKYQRKKYILEEHKSDGKIKRLIFNKENIKKLNLKENKQFLYKEEKSSDDAPEKILKLKLYQDLKINFPDASIICEYTHFELKSRADFVIFEDDKIIAIELKTAEDNLSRLKDQVKDYKKYADKVIVVINEKHEKAFLKMNLNVNYFIETKDGFIIKEYGIENDSKIDGSSLIWYKEKDNLFRRVKNQSKYKTVYKMRKLKEIIDINELSRKILKERYKSVSDECRDNAMNLFKKREFTPSDKNIFHFYPELRFEL